MEASVSDRDPATYLDIERDPADDLLGALRSRLGHLDSEGLAETLVKVVVQAWQMDGGRAAIAAALQQTSEFTDAC
jgi:hypothetical protein